MSNSVTSRLKTNLKNYNPLRRGNTRSNRNKTKRAKNVSVLRKNLLKKTQMEHNKKHSKLRTSYQHSNKYRYPTLKNILRSHRNNLVNFTHEQARRRREAREEALKEAYEAPAYMSLFGEKFEIEPTKRMMKKRLRNVNAYYPERKIVTAEQSKKYGPKGTKRSIQRIRRGLNKSRNKTQKTYSYVGLPNNVNSIYYRSKVPQMVKNSHRNYNSELYGPGVTPPKYTRFIEAAPRRKGRFTITSSGEPVLAPVQIVTPRRKGRFTIAPSSREPVLAPVQEEVRLPRKVGRYTITSL